VQGHICAAEIALSRGCCGRAGAGGGAPIRTRVDGRCGGGALTISGLVAECDPASDAPCCGNNGYCGGSPSSCDCPTCTRFVSTANGIRMVRGATTLSCGAKAMDLTGIESSMLHVYCPSSCAGEDHPIWGTDIYTDDSPVCLAAIHAGVLPRQAPGFARVLVVKKLLRHHYVGSMRNNVTTRDWVGTWHRNFRVLRLSESSAMLGTGLCAISFSGVCPTGYETSRFQFDMEDVDNRDGLGPIAAVVPLSLRNCSNMDTNLQLQCTESHAPFPTLVFCCDAGHNSTAQQIYASGTSSLASSSSFASTTAITMAGCGAISKTLTCPAGFDRSWFRFDTEDSFNQDHSHGAVPTGLREGLYPTLVMCKPAHAITCSMTAAELWRERGAAAPSTLAPNTWTPAQAAKCLDQSNRLVQADESTCERVTTGNVWISAVPGQCTNASNITMSLVGQQCTHSVTGYTWNDNGARVCAAAVLTGNSTSCPSTVCTYTAANPPAGEACTASTAPTCTCSGPPCSVISGAPQSRCTGSGASSCAAVGIAQANCEQQATGNTWRGPAASSCRINGIVVPTNNGAAWTEQDCVRPVTNNTWHAAAPASCTAQDGHQLDATDRGFCEDPSIQISVLCPRNCAAINTHRIFGSDRYALDAPVCTAAVHANALDDTVGGQIYVTKYDVSNRQVALHGTKRNGVYSFSSPNGVSSFFGITGFAPNSAALAYSARVPPIILGYLDLPILPDYRPDWSRLTDIVLMGLQIESDGSISGQAMLTEPVATLVREALRNGVHSVLAISCRSAFKFKGAMSLGAVSSTRSARLQMATRVAEIAQRLPGVHGVQLDVQDFHASDADAFTAFVGATRDQLKKLNRALSLSITLPPNTIQAAVFDIVALSTSVDFFVLMGHHLAGRHVIEQSIAVPPCPLFSSVLPGGSSLDYIVRQYLAMPGMQRERLVLAVAWFGLEWRVDGPLIANLTGAPSADVSATNGTASVVSIHEGRRRKNLFNATFDAAAGAWWYYVPENSTSSVNSHGKAVMGWLEDERSFAAKSRYAMLSMRLRGIAIANLGMEWIDGHVRTSTGSSTLAAAQFEMVHTVDWAVRQSRARSHINSRGATFVDGSCCPAFESAALNSSLVSSSLVPGMVGSGAACALACITELSRGCCYWAGGACHVSRDVALASTSLCSAGNFSLIFDQCSNVNCGPHGVCNRGGCTCTSGYSGERCQVQGWIVDEALWDALGELSGTPAQANRGVTECDLCLLTYTGHCPPGYEYSWYRFNTEVNFNADDGVGSLPKGFTETPHNPRRTMQTIAFFPRLEMCCRMCSIDNL
jgi:spore germination protein YaaH